MIEWKLDEIEDSKKRNRIEDTKAAAHRII